MKLLHLSDLHLGKRVNEFSMLEDQKYILKTIQGIVTEEQPDAVIIAGDVYDKSIPPAEAVELFDDFLVELMKKGPKIFVISGNHDSPERIAFGGRIMDAEGVHMSPVYDGNVRPVTLTDGYGPVNIWMLPFIKPVHVRKALKDESVVSYTEALRAAVARMEIDPAGRNVLITHQFVTGANRSESEEVTVGGAENVDASVFDAFDYVALGHIHSPQHCGRETLRYCGTPLKYSFSEAKDNKSVTVVELGEKGSVTVRAIPLTPKRDLVEIRGTYDELMSRAFYEGTSLRQDYTHITLTDEEDIPDAVSRLRNIYEGLMKLDYDNTRTRKNTEIGGAAEVENKSPLELFAELFEKQNNKPMSEEQTAFMEQLIEKLSEEAL